MLSLAFQKRVNSRVIFGKKRLNSLSSAVIFPPRIQFFRNFSIIRCPTYPLLPKTSKTTCISPQTIQQKNYIFSSSSRKTMERIVKDSEEALQYVNNQVANSKVVMFSKSWCPYCVKARKLLESLGANAIVIELDEMDSEDGALIQNALKAKTGQSTVPNIFINQKHIGGCDDLHKLHGDGKLKGLL